MKENNFSKILLYKEKSPPEEIKNIFQLQNCWYNIESIYQTNYAKKLNFLFNLSEKCIINVKNILNDNFQIIVEKKIDFNYKDLKKFLTSNFFEILEREFNETKIIIDKILEVQIDSSFHFEENFWKIKLEKNDSLEEFYQKFISKINSYFRSIIDQIKDFLPKLIGFFIFSLILISILLKKNVSLREF